MAQCFPFIQTERCGHILHVHTVRTPPSFWKCNITGSPRSSVHFSATGPQPTEGYSPQAAAQANHRGPTGWVKTGSIHFAGKLEPSGLCQFYHRGCQLKYCVKTRTLRVSPQGDRGIYTPRSNGRASVGRRMGLPLYRDTFQRGSFYRFDWGHFRPAKINTVVCVLLNSACDPTIAKSHPSDEIKPLYDTNFTVSFSLIPIRLILLDSVFCLLQRRIENPLSSSLMPNSLQ